MIKIIKIGNLIYEKIDPKTIDKQGNIIWNIPNDPEKLKLVLEDTLGWIVSQNIIKLIKGPDKKEASVSKAIILLAKIISTLSPDTSKLTSNEKTAFQLMTAIANNGYSDSVLLNDAFNSLSNQLSWYSQKMQKLETLSSLDDLITFAENLI